MILPLALVDRWPGESYQNQHLTIESALKHNVSDALSCHQDISRLQQIEKTLLAFNNKETRSAVKRSQIHSLISEKEEHLFRLMKFSDYPAMIMAAYPDSQFLDRARYWDMAENLDRPVLVRGISAAKIGEDAKSRGQDYYFVETGYLGNYPSPNNRTGRKIYHRIVKNDMQHRQIMSVPSDRWENLVRWNPSLQYRGWRKRGGKILVVLPSEKPFQFYGADRDQWIEHVRSTLAAHTDREIIWREKAPRAERTNDTIYDALNGDIHALVTYNSIAAVEAVSAGVPAFALAPTAAEPVCSADLTKIEHPYRPDPDLVQRWLHSIAYSQFSLEEIIKGTAWRLVQENADRSTISR